KSASASKEAQAWLLMTAPFLRVTSPPIQTAAPALLRVRPSSTLPAAPLIANPPFANVVPLPLIVPLVQFNRPVSVRSPLPVSVPPSRFKVPLTVELSVNDKEPPDRSSAATLCRLLTESPPTECSTVMPAVLMNTFWNDVGSLFVLQLSGSSQRKSPAS